jgi:hypothetical protein
MAFLALNNPGSYLGAGLNPDQLATSNLNTALGKGLNAANQGDFREVPLGQISTAIAIKALLSFDDPVTTQSSGVSNAPPQLSSGLSQNPPQRSSGVSQNPPQARPPANQISGSGNLTREGGLSFGGGFRVGGGGAPFGASAVGTTTLNSKGYQTSGGFSVGGLSANAGLKINSSGVQLSGGIQRAQVGQGIIGNKVGTGAQIGGR